MQHHFVLMDGLVGARDAIERNCGVVSISGGAWLHIHVLGFLFADFIQPLIDVRVGDFGLGVVYCDAAILA